MSAADDADDLDLPATERDAVSTGAAADSADWDERLKGLPRLLRYAMLVSDRWQRKGLGTELMTRLVQIAKQEKLDRITASILQENYGMQRICEKLGCEMKLVDEVFKVNLEL